MVAEFGDGDVVSPIGGSVNLGQAFGPLMLAYGQLVDQLGRVMGDLVLNWLRFHWWSFEEYSGFLVLEGLWYMALGFFR